jgi:hypothetical protein
MDLVVISHRFRNGGAMANEGELKMIERKMVKIRLNVGEEKE